MGIARACLFFFWGGGVGGALTTVQKSKLIIFCIEEYGDFPTEGEQLLFANCFKVQEKTKWLLKPHPTKWS